ARALHRRTRTLRRIDPGTHGPRRNADRRQRPVASQHRGQLWRPPGHRGRGTLARRGRRRGAPAPGRHRRVALRRTRRAGRPAAARPVHPHRRRHADQQFPVVAAGLYRTLVHRRPVAGTRCRYAAHGGRRLCVPRTPLRPDRRPDRRARRRTFGGSRTMTRTRVLTALAIAPFVIGAVLLLTTPWLVAIAAIVFLAALWEWFRLVEFEDTLSRTILLLANLLMMAALVWASPTDSGGSLVLFKFASV